MLRSEMNSEQLAVAMRSAVRAWAKTHTHGARLSVVRATAEQDSVAVFDIFERCGNGRNRLARVIAQVQFDGSVTIE